MPLNKETKPIKVNWMTSQKKQLLDYDAAFQIRIVEDCKRIDRMIDFYGMSTHLGLFYA